METTTMSTVGRGVADDRSWVLQGFRDVRRSQEASGHSFSHSACFEKIRAISG